MFVLLGSIAHALPGTPGEPAPNQELVWPDNEASAPRDAVIYLLERVSGLADPQITRLADGALVAATSHLLPGSVVSWRVMVPDEELEPGPYSMVVGEQLAGFTVVDTLAEVASPPAPYRRWTSTGCEEGDSLSYRACGAGLLHLAAVADAEPPAVTLDDPGAAVVVGVGEASLGLTDSFGVSAGWTGTVWIGDLDEAGRFTGWWDGDLVELATPGVRRTEAPSGTTGSTGVTATSVAECPPFSGWEILSEVDCTATEVVTATTCGCRTSGSLAGTWALALLVAVSRYRPGSPRTASRRTGRPPR